MVKKILYITTVSRTVNAFLILFITFIILLGTPTLVVLLKISFITTAPAPIMAPCPSKIIKVMKSIK